MRFEPKHCKKGMAFQFFYVFPHMTVTRIVWRIQGSAGTVRGRGVRQRDRAASQGEACEETERHSL